MEGSFSSHKNFMELRLQAGVFLSHPEYGAYVRSGMIWQAASFDFIQPFSFLGGYGTAPAVQNVQCSYKR